MPAYRRRTWWGVAVAAIVVAACKDSNGPQPQLSNPQQLASDLQTVSSVFTSPTLQSFGALRTATGSPIGAAPATGALLGAAPVVPPRMANQPYADAAARLQAMRLAASAFSPTSAASVIPPTLLGKTFVWDPNTHQYVADPTATPPAPSNGVRIILYQVDASGQIIENPLTPVGYVDLLDQSDVSTNKLEVIVNGGTPANITANYADYTVSGTVTRNASNVVTAFSASAVGFVSDGAGGHRLDFNASFSVTNLDTDNPDAQLDVTWSLNNPAVSLALHETIATPDADHATLTIDFSVTRGSETVRLAGTVTAVVSSQTVTYDLTVYVNGQVYARITGTYPNIQIRHADGTPLSQDELAALEGLFQVPADATNVIEDLFHPAEHLMGG